MDSEIKQCCTCKYDHCTIFVNPCRSCLISAKVRPNWEKKNESKEEDKT